MMAAVLIISGVCVIVFLIFYRLGIRFGASETLKTKAEQINEKALEAQRIHDRLFRDDDYASRVRRHFRR